MSTVEHEFHLAGGGPLAGLASRFRIGRFVAVVRRRALALACFAWVPALVFAIAQHVALPGPVRIPFLLDPEVYARYLLELPLFVLAELTIDQASHQAIEQFVRTGLVPSTELPALRALLEQAERRRSSRIAALVIAIVAVAPLFSGLQLGWTTEMRDSWYVLPGTGTLSLAGLWIHFVAQGVLRYLVFGWVWRLMIWAMLLGRIMLLDLRAYPAHPDAAGGLGFLGLTQARFGALAFAASIGVSGNIARNLLFSGAKLSPLYIPLAVYVLALTALLMLPLLATAPRLFRLRRQGLLDYGVLAAHYAHRFDAKWVHPELEPAADLLGSNDIQSLADIGNAYDRVVRTRVVPIDRAGLISIALAAAAPMVPLLLIDPEARVLLTEALRKLL